MAKISDKNVISGPASNRPDKAVEAGTLVSATGLSNTRCTTYLDDKLNVCLDYLKVRFNGTFSPSDDKCKPVLDALLVNHDECDVSNGVSGYRKKYTFDENVIILAGGETTRNAEGQETWLLEMKGDACRAFELRKGDWRNLIFEVINANGIATRVDAAIDDFSGLISLGELKYRIFRHLYTTSLRRTIVEGSTGLLSETDEPEVILSKNEGFTATFGGRSTKQLCIYNKKAERISKEYSVVADSWIRYEARYYHEAAETVLKEMYGAFNNNNVPVIVSGLIAGLVDFKNPHNYDHNNRYKAETWPKWKELLGHVNAITIKNQARKELTLAKKHDWLSTAAGPTLMKIWLADPIEFNNFIGYVLHKASLNLDHKAVASVNYLRKRHGKKELSFVECSDMLFNNFKEYQHGTPYLRMILKNLGINDDGEIVEDDA